MGCLLVSIICECNQELNCTSVVNDVVASSCIMFIWLYINLQAKHFSEYQIYIELKLHLKTEALRTLSTCEYSTREFNSFYFSYVGKCISLKTLFHTVFFSCMVLVLLSLEALQFGLGVLVNHALFVYDYATFHFLFLSGT